MHNSIAGGSADQACILLKESVCDLLFKKYALKKYALKKYAEVEGNRLQAEVRFTPAILAEVCGSSRAVEGSVQ
jgi:hypothetical protein